MARNSGNRDSRRSARWRIGALGFAAVLGGAMVLYAWSVLDAARRSTDWVLIVPVAAIGIAALAFAAWTDARRSHDDAEETARAESSQAPADDAAGFRLMLLVLGYAGALAYIGFDIATFLFIGLALVVQGERRWWLVAAVALCATALLVTVFQDVLGVRIPTLVM